MRRSVLFVLTLGAGCLRTPPCDPGGLCLATTPVVLRAVDDALAAVDIDGDGHADLVSIGGMGAALRRGGGDGSLSEPAVWSLPAEAEGLALGDLDGDGVKELITALPSRDSLAWLHGAAGGWEPAARELDVGAPVQSLVAADLNGDGADELIASARDSGRLYLWMGGESGPSTARHIEIGGEAIVLATGDLHGDREPLLVAAIPSLGEVALFEFSPTVGLERAGTAWTSGFPASLVAADLDADGRDDLAVLDPLERTLRVGLGDGAGGWRSEHTWPLGETPRRLFVRRGAAGQELGIISGDSLGLTLVDPLSGAARIESVAEGELDAIVAADFKAGGGDELVYLHGTVSMVEEIAGFRGLTRWTTPGEYTGVNIVADFDGDGVPELIAEDRSMSALVVFAATDSGYMEVSRRPSSRSLDGLIAAARPDGGADLVWWRSEWYNTPSPFGVLTYSPDRRLVDGPSQTMDQPIADIIAADRDGDGWGDLAVVFEQSQDDDGRALVLVTREPGGALTVGPRILEDQLIRAVVAAPIDAIAGEDLWVVGENDVWSLLGDQAAPTLLDSHLWPTARTRVLAADLDGDGQADVVRCDLDVAVAYGHADGTLDPVVTISEDECDRLSACDLDADGDLDLVVERRIQQTLRRVVEVLRADPDGWHAMGNIADASEGWNRVTACHGQQVLQWTGEEQAATLREVVPGPSLREAKLPGQFIWPVLAADLNGDGLDDLFTHNVYTLSYSLADGEGGYRPMQNIAMLLATGHYVDELRTAELDGRPGKELLARIKETGNEAQRSRVVWSLRDDALVAVGALDTDFTSLGDFDGDGRDELLIAGKSPRLVWLGADGSTARTLALDPGLFTGVKDIRVADMDGDGRDDLLVGDGDAVAVLRSSGGGFEAPRTWAIAVDHKHFERLGVGDIDGDGATDIFTRAPGTPEYVVARGDGKGGMRAVSRHLAPDDTHYSDFAPLIDDIDGDGRADIVALVDGTPPALQVIRLDATSEPIERWPIGALTASDAIFRVQLTADEPAWVVTGRQGAIVMTHAGGRR